MTELELALQRFAGDGTSGDGAGAAVQENAAAEGSEEPEKAEAAEMAEPQEASDMAEEEIPEEPAEPDAEIPTGQADAETEAEPAGSPSSDGEEKEAPKELSLEERLAALEEALAKQNEMLEQREHDRALRLHFSGLEKQAEAIKSAFPDFDLRAELNDPVFVRLTSPMVGLSVEDAYYAIHHREITEAGARAAAQMLGNSVQAGRNMPNENGSIQRGTPDGGYRPLAELSPEERRLRMDMIRSGKLRFD